MCAYENLLCNKGGISNQWESFIINKIVTCLGKKYKYFFI